MIGAIIILIEFCFLSFCTGYNISKRQLCKTMHDMVDSLPNDANEEFIKGILFVFDSLRKIM